jgi:hypothetical protein
MTILISKNPTPQPPKTAGPAEGLRSVVAHEAPSEVQLVNAQIARMKKESSGPRPPRNWRHVLDGDFDTIFEEEAATIIGKTTKTLQRWRKIEYGPPFRVVGRFIEYSRTAVKAWKAKNDCRRTPSHLLRPSGDGESDQL